MQKDKIYHFSVGLVLALIGMVFLSLYLVIILGLVVFIGKEIYDTYKSSPTGFSGWDLLADGVGFVVGVLIYFCVR